MTNRTNALLAVALLLAMGAPASQAVDVNGPCVDDLDDDAKTLVKQLTTGIKADVNALPEEGCAVESCKEDSVGLIYGRQGLCLTLCKSDLCDVQPCRTAECLPPIPECNLVPGRNLAASFEISPTCERLQDGLEPPAAPCPKPGFDNLGSKAFGPPDCPRTCAHSDDDGGFGGTHTKCYYSCPDLSELVIAMSSNDLQATVYGETSCGGAVAFCNAPAPTCAGVSGDLTSFSDDAQACKGNSDEINDSPLLVACSAIGVGFICDLIRDLCDLGMTASAAKEICLAQNHGLANQVAQASSMFALLPSGNLLSFVTFQTGATGGLAIHFESGDQPLCWLEVF